MTDWHEDRIKKIKDAFFNEHSFLIQSKDQIQLPILQSDGKSNIARVWINRIRHFTAT